MLLNSSKHTVQQDRTMQTGDRSVRRKKQSHALLMRILLRLRVMPRPLTSKQKWLPEKNSHSIVRVGLAEQSIAYPIRAKTALCRLQK